MKNVANGLIAVLILILWIPGAHADQFQIRPYITVRGEYDSNIFFSANSDDEESDYILTIKPGVLLSERTERLDARLRAEIAPFFYKDNSDLDEVDQNYRGRINYQFTPRLYGGADAFYIQDHRVDRDLLDTGLVQNADRRDRYHFGGALGYNLTEITSTNVSYDFNRDNWDRQSGRNDVDYNSVNLGLSHNLSRWLRETKGQLVFGYSNVDRDNSEADSVVGTVSVRYRITELLRLRLRGGARYVTSDFDVQTGTDPDTGQPIIEEESNTGWSGVGSAFLAYTGDRTRASLLFSHDLSPGSGRGSASVLTRGAGGISYRLLESLNVRLSGGVYRNKANEGEFGAREINQYNYNIRPSIRWDFYDNFSLTGAYRHTYVDNRVTDRNTNRNEVFLQVGYGLPLFDLLDLSGTELRQVVTGVVPPREAR
ncbi:MAG: hypothetical protein GY850_25660 [bacterium]|nr:hypothetical protein [bacterium]